MTTHTAPRPHAQTALPPVVDMEEWQRQRDALLILEKAHTRAGDALAAARRRLPMVPVASDYTFQGPDGPLSFLDLFEGRRQLIVYHHMLRPNDPEPCGGCSAWGDAVPQELGHLHARDASLVLVALAPIEEIEAYKKDMGWTMPFVSWAGSTFGEEQNLSPWAPGSFGISVFVRDGEEVYRTYFTMGRGAESVFRGGFLDALPFGRQEAFENSPDGWPQAPTYTLGERHVNYTPEQLSGATAPSSTGQVAAAPADGE